jgi:ABC-type dipeptide/oligopeptide/nickel transport system permease component
MIVLRRGIVFPSGVEGLMVLIFYIIRRVLFIPITLFGISLIVFSMIGMLSPYQRLATFISSPDRLKSENVDQLISMYGLDDPIPIQYGRWFKNLLQGNLGWSYVGKAPVLQALLQRFPYTLELTLFSAIPIILIGTWMGVLSALHHNRTLDHSLRIFAVVGWSFPDFVFGLFILMIFYSTLGLFPPGNLSLWAESIVKSTSFRSFTGMTTIDALLNGRLDVFELLIICLNSVNGDGMNQNAFNGVTVKLTAVSSIW